MKIIGLTLSAILATAAGVYAQSGRNMNLLHYANNSSPFPRVSTRAADSAPLKAEYMNDVNLSAVRDFIKRFNEPGGARWYKMDEGYYMAKFEVPDIAYRVVYTPKGGWMYTIQTYHEKQLPHDIRAIVKSTYYDYSITQVEEINHVDAAGIVYVVHLKDDVSWKTVRVSNGEMDVMETLYKK